MKTAFVAIAPNLAGLTNENSFRRDRPKPRWLNLLKTAFVAIAPNLVGLTNEKQLS